MTAAIILLIGFATALAVTLGYILGTLTRLDNANTEWETAYLYGHVDGYSKAVRDEL